MSELTVVLLGLLFISCPVTLFIGLVGGIIVYRALLDKGKENGNHKRVRTVLLPEIPKGQVYHTIKRWKEDGWDYQIMEAIAVGKYDVILSKVL